MTNYHRCFHTKLKNFPRCWGYLWYRVMVGRGVTSEGGAFLLSSAVSMTPILYIAAQLVLPVYLLISQANGVPLIHLVYQLNWEVGISTATCPTIMMPQPPILSFDLLLVVRMPLFEGGGTFSQSPDFYAILASRMVGRFEEKSRKILLGKSRTFVAKIVTVRRKNRTQTNKDAQNSVLL